MRQAGLLAACGIVAIERMVARLKDDHEAARVLADGLHKIDPSLTEPRAVETNIVMVSLPGREDTSSQWIGALHEHGVLTASPGPNALRLVTHRHIGRTDVERTIAAFATIHAEQRTASNAA
jgi:threonine aldolase